MSTDVTRILDAIDRGSPQAAKDLLPAVYDELRDMAARRLRQERPGQTLQATALVHEAYLRLVGPDRAVEPDREHTDGPQRFAARGQFFAAAAESMRRILIDRARARGTAKRGRDVRRLDLDANELLLDDVPVELLDLDDALAALATEDPAKVELVTLRFFGGLTQREAAAALGISVATADRHWAYARAWLFDRMGGRAADD